MHFVTSFASIIFASAILASPVSHAAESVSTHSLTSKRFDCPFGVQPCQLGLACDIQASLACTVYKYENIIANPGPTADAIAMVIRATIDDLRPIPGALIEPLATLAVGQKEFLKSFVAARCDDITTAVAQILEIQAATIPFTTQALTEVTNSVLDMVAAINATLEYQ